MMTSEIEVTGSDEAYVWIWLPGKTDPVVAGRLYDAGVSPQRYFFAYGRSYLERADAIPLSPYELPLRRGHQEPQGMSIMPSCLRDGSPDAWGQRVLKSKYGDRNLTAVDFLLLSLSDRIGALDFQGSSSEFQARETSPVQMDELLRAAEIVEKRQPLPPELDQALLQGSAVGGARPKALVQQGDRGYIAKFSTSTDTYDVIRAEYLAMRLAKKCGLDVAAVSLVSSMNKDVLLVERFDRIISAAQTHRKHMLSGLSLLLLDEMEARHASYLELADLVRQRFAKPKETLHELFSRLCFNILVGNTDDHARNHAAFWDGDALALTPAYDICPQSRAGGEASQAMDIGGNRDRLSTLDNVRSVCHRFMLSREEATALMNRQKQIIEAEWEAVCDEAGLAQGERERLWGGAVLHPFCLEGWD